MMKLVVMNGELAGVELPLDAPEVTLGRRSDNDLSLPGDMKVSRRHARVFQQNGQPMLEDVGSANGTFVGQRRIYAPTPLEPGDRCRMGRTWFEVVAAADDAAEESAEARAAQQVVFVEGGGGAPEQKLGEPASYVFSLDASTPAARATTAEELQQRLAVMFEFGLALGSILEMPRLLRVAAQRIMEVIPAEQASLLLVDPESGDIVPRVVRSRTGEMPEGQLRISRHMVTTALEERLAVLTTDATADARFSDADSVQELRIRSAICAPMVTHNRTVGAIYLDTSSGTHVFSEPDVHLVAGIAAQTAIAIENARLYTDLRGAYDELQSAQEQLVRSERLAGIGMLAASIAHDMANIVSPMKPLIEMVLAGKDVDNRARGVLGRQTERLVTLVERLQAFSRTTALQLEPTDLNTVVDNTLALVATELIHRKVELKLSLVHPAPVVLADSAQLERALLNLIVNAAEALDGCETRQIEICTEAEEDEALVSVRDTGPGIPVDKQARMFEPFFTTKATGTGLGLYSCRRIVEEEHGGSLELDSREGAGTTITIRLPLGKPRPSQPPPA
jgi:signal transduction histidine kinase